MYASEHEVVLQTGKSLPAQDNMEKVGKAVYGDSVIGKKDNQEMTQRQEEKTTAQKGSEREKEESCVPL